MRSLAEELLKPASMTQSALRRRLAGTRARTSEFLNRKRDVTADAALDLAEARGRFSYSRIFFCCRLSQPAKRQTRKICGEMNVAIASIVAEATYDCTTWPAEFLHHTGSVNRLNRPTRVRDGLVGRFYFLNRSLCVPVRSRRRVFSSVV